MEKILFTLVGVLWASIMWDVYEVAKLNQKCKDAGGIRAGSICVNPTAIIEVD